jgi:hypothetical protein
MSRRLLSTMLAGLLVAACGTAQPSATPEPPISTLELTTPTPEPTTPPQSPAPTGGPFDGLPYAIDLPEGWVIFDLTDPASAAALDSFVAANPDMAAAIEAFKSLPNVRMAVNLALGNVVVTFSLPSQGLSLETLAMTFTAQFAAVPGIKEAPVQEDKVVAGEQAAHWHLAITGNDPNGGTFDVGESIYLFVNDTTAALVEFVEVGGVPIPQENQIVETFRFTP